MDINQDCIPRIATGFGGGIGKQGEICGAVSGGIILVGLAAGRMSSEDKHAKETAYRNASNLISRFKQNFGAFRCTDLLELDIGEPSQLENYRSMNLKEMVCSRAVETSLMIVLELIDPRT
jgi:C_GCAxxG_C_C family probable redox protein